RPLHGGDHRLVQFKSGRAERPARNFAAIAARLRRRNIELAERIICVERADIFEIPAPAKSAARALEHPNLSIAVAVDGKKGLCERIGALGIHGVARFGAIVDDCPDRPGLFYSDCHGDLSGWESGIAAGIADETIPVAPMKSFDRRGYSAPRAVSELPRLSNS